MKNLLLSLLLISGLSLAITQTSTAQNDREAYRTDLFSTGATPYVNISTSGGFINAIGHDKSTVRVEMHVRHGRKSLKPEDTDLSDFDIIIKQDGNTITVSAEYNQNTSRWLTWRNDDRESVSFIVYVPTSALVKGRTSGGSVSAQKLDNDVELRTSGGSVSVSQINGNIALRTSGGTVAIADANGNVDARTSGGSMNVKNTTGIIDIRTSGGSINISNVTGSVDARTSGGSINATLTDVSGYVSLRTSGGSINVVIPDNEGFDLNLRGNRVNMNLVDFTGSTERGKINGSIRGGGHQISAHTSGGSVQVRYQ